MKRNVKQRRRYAKAARVVQLENLNKSRVEELNRLIDKNNNLEEAFKKQREANRRLINEKEALKNKLATYSANLIKLSKEKSALETRVFIAESKRKELEFRNNILEAENHSKLMEIQQKEEANKILIEEAERQTKFKNEALNLVTALEGAHKAKMLEVEKLEIKLKNMMLEKDNLKWRLKAVSEQLAEAKKPFLEKLFRRKR